MVDLSASDAADLGLLQAAAALRDRRLSAVELAEACLGRIEQRNGGAPSFDGAADAINAWVRVYPEVALAQAREADERLRREGAEAPLACGIPLALKDLYAVAGLPLTASSRVLEGNMASRDAVAWRRLRDAGAVLVGHTHMHEFAAGGTTDQVGNPWAPVRVAGGSSGGNAAALAAHMIPVALGTDTCGSLRIPSACCGTSTIKPSHGVIPLNGVIPLAPTLDHVGPMARTVADCAALLDALAAPGSEPTLAPPATVRLPQPPAPSAGPRPLAGLTVVAFDRGDELAIDRQVAAAFQQGVQACEQLGGRVVARPAPSRLDADALTAVLLTEVWCYHRRFAHRADRYRPAIAELVQAARGFTDAQRYLDAQASRARDTTRWEQWFAAERIDLVLEPTLPITPPPRGEGYDPGHAGGAGDPLIALTALWDMTGMPVASLPVSWQTGVSLVAPRGQEPQLVQAAIDLQEHALGVPELSQI